MTTNVRPPPGTTSFRLVSPRTFCVHLPNRKFSFFFFSSPSLVERTTSPSSSFYFLPAPNSHFFFFCLSLELSYIFRKLLHLCTLLLAYFFNQRVDTKKKKPHACCALSTCFQCTYRRLVCCCSVFVMNVVPLLLSPSVALEMRAWQISAARSSSHPRHHAHVSLRRPYQIMISTTLYMLHWCKINTKSFTPIGDVPSRRWTLP